MATSEELAPEHPEKALLVRRDFAEKRNEEHLALIAALLKACEFCARPENRERVMETLAQSRYVGAPIQALRMSLGGTFDYGNGRVEKQSRFHIFAGDHVNEPSLEKAHWVIRNLLASGVVGDASEIPSVRAPEWFRADLFRESARLFAGSR